MAHFTTKALAVLGGAVVGDTFTENGIIKRIRVALGGGKYAVAVESSQAEQDVEIAKKVEAVATPIDTTTVAPTKANEIAEDTAGGFKISLDGATWKDLGPGATLPNGGAWIGNSATVAGMPTTRPAPESGALVQGDAGFLDDDDPVAGLVRGGISRNGAGQWVQGFTDAPATTVVDDDTTGGAADAWSAERGKQIRTDLTAEIASTDTEQTAQDALILQNTNHRNDANKHLPDATGQADKVAVSAADGSYSLQDRIQVSPANYIVGFGVPATLSAAKQDVYYEQLDATEGENNVWGPTDAAGVYPAQADNRSADILVLQDVTATTGAEFTEPRRMSLEQFDQRVFINGDEVDITTQTNATLTVRKLNIVDNTTTLNLATGAEKDRAWTWNTQTDQVILYRHDGVSYRPEAEDHEHTVLDNIAVFVRSAGTNAGSAVQLDFFDKDGVAYPSTDWTVSTAPVTGLESYTAHGPIIVSDVPYTGTFAIAHNKQGFLFFKYVGDNANGLSSVTYTGTNGANSDGQIIVNFVGTNYHVDFANKAAVELTEFTSEAEVEATAKSWIFSSDNMNAVDGDKIIVQPGHNINFPGVVDLESVQLAPSTGNWSDIAAGTGSFTPDAAWTFGVNQSLLFGSDIITAIANLGSTNWLLLSGGEDAPSQDQRFETVALLPGPATVNPGAVAVVYGDPTPANNKPYTARTDGVTQTLAVAWS